ncbi:transposase [Staphylococcus xylosus]|uniref:transposase n=1 Tax=Staphylococcus xylosus TaxID=1288 RepID=UPI003F56237E
MSKIYFDQAYKDVIVELYLEGKAIKDIIEEYEIPTSSLYKWIKDYQTAKNKSYLSKEESAYFDNLIENVKLKKEIAILKSALRTTHIK